MAQNPAPTLPMQGQRPSEDALSSQKFIAEAYNSFANECAAANIRDELLNILQDEHNIQADIFGEMQKTRLVSDHSGRPAANPDGKAKYSPAASQS